MNISICNRQGYCPGMAYVYIYAREIRQSSPDAHSGSMGTGHAHEYSKQSLNPTTAVSTNGPWIFTARKGFHIVTKLYEYHVNIFQCQDKTRVWISIIPLLSRTRDGRLSNDRNDVYATCYPKDLEAILEISFSKYEEAG